jgi:hypothetical protein
VSRKRPASSFSGTKRRRGRAGESDQEMAPPQSVVNTVPAAAVQPAPAPFDWRAHLPVYPAAALYPLMAEADPAAFKDLVEDIKTNGLIEPLVFWNIDGQFILDGRNRLDALASLGLLYETPDHHVGVKTWTVGKGWSDKAPTKKKVKPPPKTDRDMDDVVPF